MHLINSKKKKMWAEVKKLYRLSASFIELVKKLDLNPKRLGAISYHNQEPRKQQLSEFILEPCYRHLSERISR